MRILRPKDAKWEPALGLIWLSRTQEGVIWSTQYKLDFKLDFPITILLIKDSWTIRNYSENRLLQNCYIGFDPAAKSLAYETLLLGETNQCLTLSFL